MTDFSTSASPARRDSETPREQSPLQPTLLPQTPTPEDRAGAFPKELRDAASALEVDIEKLNVVLLPARSPVSMADIRTAVPHGEVFVADFYVTGIERGERIVGGFRRDGITNVDHHAPTREMQGMISSTPLAIEYVKRFGAVPPEIPIVLNHTDCDSVLTLAVLRGLLPPHELLGAAALAADHTGGEDPVADLLQSLTRRRDLALSLTSLKELLTTGSLNQDAVEALRDQVEQRAAARELVETGALRRDGPVAFVQSSRYVDGVFFPALVPDAALIVVARPLRETETLEMKIRLGLAGPEGLSLHDLNLASFDPNFGGRWNAGSNQRAGGSRMTVEAYARCLRDAFERWRGDEN